MRILSSTAIGAVLAALAAAPAAAQTAPVTFLGRILAAAGLSPAPEASIGRSVTVVTGDDLQERGGEQLADALRRVPGAAVTRTGGPGGMTHLRLRGTEGRHTLVLVDGVRMDTPQNGEFDFAGLQTADIERIEIVRGPQSVFFGSNTIGGVVAITTRRGTEPGFSGHAGTEAGSDGTLGADFLLSQRGERGGLSLSGVVRNEGGWDVSATPGGERDGMRNRTLNLAGDWQLTEDWRIGFLLRERRQLNDTDPQWYGLGPIETIVRDGDDWTRTRERVASVYAEGDLLDARLRLTLRASRYVVDTLGQSTSLDFVDPTIGFPGMFDNTGDRTEFALRGVYALDGGSAEGARHSLGFGLDRMAEGYVINRFEYDPSQLVRQSRTLTGLSLEYRGELAQGLDLQLGVRRDLNDRFRDFTTWSTALSWSLPQTGTRLRLSAGTGVQNPSLIAQFGFIPNTYEGNPDLVPEQSRGWDIGVEQDLGGGTLSATYFDNRLSNRIISVYDPSTGISRPDNAPGSSRRRGVELAYDGQIAAALWLRAAYTYTDARGEAGEQLARRPRHEATLGLDWDATDRTRLSMDIRRVVGNHDLDWRGYAGTTVPLPNVTLVHLAASHRLNGRVSLHARINNVMDRPYQEVLGYAGQGRTFYVGLRANF